jgi:hypothetical protein
LIDLTRLSRTPTARKATDDARMMLKIGKRITPLSRNENEQLGEFRRNKIEQS